MNSDRVIRQWTVKGPHDVGPRIFEKECHAWAHAADAAHADAPAVVTTPQGTVFYMFREAAEVEVSTRHRLVGNTRRVVEHP